MYAIYRNTKNILKEHKDRRQYLIDNKVSYEEYVEEQFRNGYVFSSEQAVLDEIGWAYCDICNDKAYQRTVLLEDVPNIAKVVILSRGGK